MSECSVLTEMKSSHALQFLCTLSFGLMSHLHHCELIVLSLCHFLSVCLVFLFPQAVSFPGDFSYAAAGLIFLEYTASAQWCAELLVITYSGQLKSYLVG